MDSLLLASLFMPIIETKRAIGTILSVFGIEEVEEWARRAYLALLG